VQRPRNLTRRKALVAHPAAIFDAHRSRLRALGKPLQEFGQLGVTVLLGEPSDDVAPPPAARTANDPHPIERAITCATCGLQLQLRYAARAPRCRPRWQSGARLPRRGSPSQHYANNKLRGTRMSNEFEKLAALLHRSEPGERAPQIDRVEAARLAARWGRLVQRSREQPVEPQMRRPQLGARS